MYHASKLLIYLSFTVHYFYPVSRNFLSIRIVLSQKLLIFYFEKFSTWIWQAFNSLIPWPLLTQSDRSRRSFGKIGDCEQSKTWRLQGVVSHPMRMLRCLKSVKLNRKSKRVWFCSFRKEICFHRRYLALTFKSS